jgi:hypothetical protein
VERHVDVLAILATLWGALAIVLAISMLLLAAGALAGLADPAWPGGALAAGLAGAFVFIGAFALSWGGVHVWAGTLLRRRRPFGRVLMLALGVINLLVLPFGTALGVYALWVLLANDARRLFEPAR